MNPDLFPTRVVVLALALVVVGGLASIVWLASTQTTIPDALDRLVFTSLGSLGTLLAKTTYDYMKPTQEVEVMNTPENPVPVDNDAEAGQTNWGGGLSLLFGLIVLLIILRVLKLI